MHKAYSSVHSTGEVRITWGVGGGGVFFKIKFDWPIGCGKEDLKKRIFFFQYFAIVRCPPNPFHPQMLSVKFGRLAA